MLRVDSASFGLLFAALSYFALWALGEEHHTRLPGMRVIGDDNLL